GVFGRVKHYYGVIEAQNRGSLHLHILIWLEGALSSLEIQQQCSSDSIFRGRLFEWLESIFQHQLPDGTVAFEGPRADKTHCLLGRPPHPDNPEFNAQWPQFLRNVLDVSGHVHSHSETCFKNLPVSISSLTAAQQDEHCRFNYPQESNLETSMDDNGKISHKRLDSRVVGYNPTISGSFQCNTDGKFIGSGPLDQAFNIYMTNYTAKSTLDSPIVMSALAAANKSLELAAGQDTPCDEERCRKLLLKTLNQMVSRRELSAQQVSSALLGFPNHITDAHFSVFYW
ncbi:hypothetical protein C8J56DRAFT_713521, partial [Mycena floridula]